MRLQSRRIRHAQPPIFLQYICKNTKNIQKVDDMDGFCWQSELDLTLFYKIEGYFDNLKSLMTGFMNICTHIHQEEFARDE